MKKFLSLVLALIMTMSLVTISAGATEYKDFTDKDEIQYEEAVAVLNRLGIITGYTEGDFRPEGELTRGAAAKIIASLLLGPDAANNLAPSAAPFKDVPLDHTFAGPISYCANLKIINGYSDGSFQPGGTLTGYAFSKMLLGALGYDGNIEGFTGAGWNMNVMRLGGEAGLFDSISFKGNDPVNREEAAQLALNTLKGTMVEYSGGLNITAGDATINSDPTRAYKTSNQEFATHISNRKAGGNANYDRDNWYTVEFGEEHFVDLRMTHDRNTFDDFGRPSNEWSYKKVTIGTFPLEPDYIYTEQMAHDVDTVTNAAKARALGLTGFEVLANTDHGATRVTVNGKSEADGVLKNVGEIADYTDNGTVVEVYISEDSADWVQDVVVVKTQLMEVKRISKDSVSLDLYDGGSANKTAVIGFNQAPINEKVDNVEIDDAYYTLLSGLKVGDRVAVVPVTTDDVNYSVAKAYVPETVSGNLKKVETYGNASDVKTIGVTVADTAYDVALWNKDLVDIDGTKLQVTTKDVTLTLDEFGNALLAEDVGATSDFMVVGSYYQNLVNGKLVTYAQGWDISGEELNLNLGSKTTVRPENSGIWPGDLVYYTNSTQGDADWELSASTAKGVFDVFTGVDVEVTGGTTPYSVKASNTRIRTLQAYIDGAKADGTAFVAGTEYTIGDTSTEAFKPWIDKSIKFIYVSFDDNGDVDSIEIKSGVQAANTEELARCYAHDNHPTNGSCEFNAAQAALKLNKNGAVDGDSTVKAVVIKNESNDAVATNMLYVVNYYGSGERQANGDIVYGYTVAMNGPDGIIDDEMIIYSTKRLNRGDWARYTKTEYDGYDEFYTLSAVDQRFRATSTMTGNFLSIANGAYPTANKSLLVLDSNKLYAIDGTKLSDDLGVAAKYNLPTIKTNINNLGTGDNNASFLVSLRYARWVDLTGNGIDSYDDLADITATTDGIYDLENVKVSMIFNDDSTKDNFRQVAMIVVQDVGAKRGTTTPTPNPDPDVTAGAIKFVNDTTNAENALDGLYIDISGATYFLNDSITADSNGRVNVGDISTNFKGISGGAVTLVAGENTTVRTAGTSTIVELVDKTKGGTVKVKFAANRTLTIGATMSDWTVGGTAAGTVVEGAPVSITFTQDVGNEGAVGSLDEGDVLVLDTDYTATGLPEGAVVTLTTQGNGDIAATYNFTEVTVDAAYIAALSLDDASSLSSDDVDKINALGLYTSNSGAGTALSVSASGSFSAGTYYTRSVATPAVTAKASVITITFNMPAANVNFSAFDLI